MGINREPKSMFYLLLNETFVYDVPALSNIIRPMVNLQKTKESIAFDLFLHLLRVSINYLFVDLAMTDIMFPTFIAPQYILSQTFTRPGGVTGKVLWKLLTGGNPPRE